jgi:hypothetical protein
MKNLLLFLSLIVAIVGNSQQVSGNKFRYTGAWWTAKDTASATSADTNCVFFYNNVFYYRGSSATHWKAIASANDLTAYVKYSDTAAMVSNLRRKSTLIENADLRNSAITINGTIINLGGSGTIATGLVTSITGTANQISVTPTTGAAVASFPSAVIFPGTISSTGATVAGSLTVSGGISGTLTSSAQPNITSVGSLSSLNVNGAITGTSIISTGNFSTTQYFLSGSGVAVLKNSASGFNGDWVMQTAAGVNRWNLGHQVAETGSGNTGYDLYGYSYDDAGASLGQWINVKRSSRLTTLYDLSVTNNIAGTLSTAAQPNITSVGTLSSLNVSGSSTLAGLTTSSISNSGNFTNTGYLRITSYARIGTYDGSEPTAPTSEYALIVGSNISTAKSIYALGSVDASTLGGTLTTAAQPNITSVGTLTQMSTATSYTSGRSYIGTSTITNGEMLAIRFRGGSGEIGVGVRSGDASSNPTYAQWFTNSGSSAGSIDGVGTTAAVTYGTTSDSSMKKNVLPAALALPVIENIGVVQFDWKDGDLHEPYGFIAQQLYKYYPNAVQKPTADQIAKGKRWAVDYGKLTPLALKGIQEQQLQLTNMRAQIDDLKTENKSLKAELESIKAILKRNNIQ